MSLSISACFTCSESKLLTSMKDLSAEIHGVRVLALFAKGNNVNVIREYFINHKANGIEVGLIEYNHQSEEGSSGLYNFIDNPRVLILDDSGEVILCEPTRLRKDIQDYVFRKTMVHEGK